MILIKILLTLILSVFLTDSLSYGISSSASFLGTFPIKGRLIKVFASITEVSFTLTVRFGIPHPPQPSPNPYGEG